MVVIIITIMSWLFFSKRVRLLICACAGCCTSWQLVGNGKGKITFLVHMYMYIHFLTFDVAI